MSDSGHLFVIQPAGLFLSVTADEWHGATLLEKGGAVFYLPVLYFKGPGDMIHVNTVHRIIASSVPPGGTGLSVL